jgi:hypothetical protein
MNWIYLAQDRDNWQALASAVMKLRFPQNMGNFWTICESVNFSKSTMLHGRSKLAI